VKYPKLTLTVDQLAKRVIQPALAILAANIKRSKRNAKRRAEYRRRKAGKAGTTRRM
jgi:hypothetical protein